MSSASSGFGLLDHKSQTPITNLSPDLPDQATRAVAGEITLVWPYNTATQSLAFLLTDPDARRRREKGQVRVQLQGPSAKAVSTLRLGGGDTVAIDLDGVEWVKDSSVVRVPGSRVDWQLQFTAKLTLQAKIGDPQTFKQVNVNNHAEPDVAGPPAQPTLPAAEEAQMTAAPATGEPDIPAPATLDIPIINPITMELDEYPSPAFMKRARLSYGALFEDPEKKEEDGGVKGKGRKRTRFGRDSSSWRYASHSPSPSPEAEPKTPPQTAEAAVEVDIQKPTPPKPQMADEGSQTVDFKQALAPPRQPATGLPSDHTARRQEERQASPAKDQPSQPSSSLEARLPVAPQEEDSPRRSPVQQPAKHQKAPETSKPAPQSRYGSNTLFGNYTASQFGYNQPRFGTSARADAGSGLSIANQVRFGFSHTPQTDYPQQQPQQLSHSAPAPHRAVQDYPESHLQPSDPSKYADMESYVDQAEQEMETEPPYAYDGQDLNPPGIESFAGGQFDMATQAPGYNPVEGGHFGADALDEGIRITTDGYAMHNGEIDVDKVPPGFASFGGSSLQNQIDDDDMDEDEDDDEDDEETHIPGEDFVENDEIEDDLDDEVALEDRDETEYGPEGEILEQGDYDQREYNIPEEDQDQLSEEEHQNELQALAQNNDPDVIDEDELYGRMDDNEGYDDEEEEVSLEGEGDQGSFEEEEEEEEVYDEEEDDQDSYDEDEGSSEGSYSQPPNSFYDNTTRRWVQRGAASMRPPPPPAQPKEPVVIDLLSSDDEDDAPPARPAKQPAPEASKPPEPAAAEPVWTVERSVAAPVASVPSEPPAKQDPTPTHQNLSTGDQHDAVLEPSPGPEQRVTLQERARRKSSGSHLYGENIEEPVDDSNMDLHLPSTPPPDTRQPKDSGDMGKQDAAVVDEEFDDSASSIPCFNGAAESLQVNDDSKDAQHVSGGERGENDPSETASIAQPSALEVDPTEATASLEKREDAPEDQEMPDAVTQRAFSPQRSIGDADGSEASGNSADISKRDVAEAERLFEEVPAPDEDTAMADERPRQHSVGSPAPARQKETDGYAELPPTASSPPRSPSFASQVFISSPPRQGRDSANLPTAMGTQQSQMFMPRQIFASSSPASDAAVTLQESAGGPVVAAETIVETHVHVEQQVATPMDEEDNDAVSKPDVQMTDAPADDDHTAPVPEQPLDLTENGEDEDEVDVENQIEAQLQYEIVRTTMHASGGHVTVVRETRKLSVMHPDNAEEDVPVEPASLDQAMQEDLMLQEQVDEELASQVGDEDDTARVANEEVDIADDVEDDDNMEGDADDEPVVVDDEMEEIHDEVAVDAGDEDELAAPETIVEEPADDETAADEVAPGGSADEAGQTGGTPLLQREDTVKSTIAVAPDEDEEEVILIGEEEAPHRAEAEATTPPKPKQELEVLIRPLTRSQRARDQQSQSTDAAPPDDTSARETTREVSPEVSKAPKRALGGLKRSTRSKEVHDSSVELAKASIQKSAAGKRVTRQRSASAQPAVPTEAAADEDEQEEEGEGEDSSVALAIAGLNSPSMTLSEPATKSPTAFRADLVRRLRVALAEFTALKAMRSAKKGRAHVLAVVACDPPEPQRTKHRDYHTTVTVTDASVAPEQAVEVQFMDLHKVYLPAVRQGDTMVLRNFDLVALPDKQFALRQVGEESSWAVFDADYEVPGSRGGPDFEMQEAVRDYLHDLRVWYNDLDVTDREKLVTAVAKLAEVEGSSG